MSCPDTSHPLKLQLEAGSQPREGVSREAEIPSGPTNGNDVPKAGCHPAEQLSLKERLELPLSRDYL